MSSKKPLTDEQFLELFKISDNKYLLGIFQDGITLYKQQIRALNIFHSLISTKQLKPGQTVGIIGGGVAGLTFAAAALMSGIKVEIIEKHSSYLHLQSGCDIRRVHPNIYEWPDEKSLFPYAVLPVLSWKYDTASNVCKQILNEFKKIETLVNKRYAKNKKPQLTEYTNCSEISSIEPGSGKDKNKIKVSFTTSQNLKSFYDVLIFAVGYGIERDTIDGKVPSYWRNDALGQSFLNHANASFLVSGDGDGGLIDVCRLLISDFSYESVLEILQKNIKNYSKLIEALSSIKRKGPTTDNPSFLHDEFSKIDSGLYEHFIKELENRKLLRKTTVYLNGKKNSFSEALDFKRVSLINAFIVFLLERYRKLEYVSGEFSDISIQDKYKDCLAVIRHGTAREHVFDGIPLSEENKRQLEHIRSLQQETYNSGAVEPRYNFGDLMKIFYGADFKSRIEYVTPDTESFCSFFSHLLYKGISSQNKVKDFRVTLHRVISLQNEMFYQQISPYPNKKDNPYLGRVHPIDRGIVGVAVKTGKSVLLINENQIIYKKIFGKLNLETKYLLKKEVESALAIPIVSTFESKDKKSYAATNLVLYIDSKAKKFFTIDILKLIIASLSGFVHSMNEMLESGKITMEPVEFVPQKIVTSSVISPFNKSCCYDLTKEPWNMGKNIKKLRFNHFQSFDIIYKSFGLI